LTVKGDDRNPDQEALAKAAKFRLELCRLERRYFKTSHQIAFELLLYLVSNHGEANLSDVYNYFSATDAVIRQHLRSLENAGLLTVKNHVEDQRARKLFVTPVGLDIFASYFIDAETAEGKLRGVK
jgi:DNA-binding MarR family transcriptional regulator